ncbi:MAG: hypothetical protein QOE05_2126 [Actinomycetota bacterium]|jgi:hypothetical protein|nr:hypothetical protein [Actinomycetota bacterium]
MTTSSLSFIPAQRAADDEPAAPKPASAPHEVSQISRDDMVMLPRHIADAAYHVLQAIHALKDNGSNDLFNTLGKALNKGAHRPIPHVPPPCEVCHIDVAHGLEHHSECWSEEAVAHRSFVLPQLEPEG